VRRIWGFYNRGFCSLICSYCLHQLLLWFKMSSFYVLKALSTFSSLFQRFETIPIIWSVEEKKFVHISDPKKLVIWKVNIFIGYFFANGLCVFLLAREIFSPTNSMPLFFALLQMALVILATLWLVVAITSVKMGDDYVRCWNGSRDFLVKLRSESSNV